MWFVTICQDAQRNGLLPNAGSVPCITLAGEQWCI